MKLLVPILFSLLFHAGSGQMMGGEEARQGQFPFAAQIHQLNCLGQGCLCGGSIVGARWVLTAAHCIKMEGTVRRVAIVMGDVYKVRPEGWHREEIESEHVQVHLYPEYNRNESVLFDAALLEITRHFDSSENIKMILFASDDSGVPSRCTVMGWGRTRANFETNTADERSPVLRHGKMNVTFVNFRNIIFQRMNRETGPYILEGDSGSPLMCRDINQRRKQRLFGWMSSGNIEGDYAIYLRLKFFKDWIETTMGAQNPGNFPVFDPPVAQRG